AISGPSRSKRTTGKRSELMLARHLGVLVLDRDEVEAPRRGRRAGLGARPALEELGEPVGRQLDHRPDERPHHAPEEAVGRDLEVEVLAAAVPLGPGDDPDEALVLRLARREGAEVVLAEQEVRGLVEPPLVERARQPPAPPQLEGRRRAAAEDAVAVAAGAREAAGVEAGRGR